MLGQVAPLDAQIVAACRHRCVHNRSRLQCHSASLHSYSLTQLPVARPVFLLRSNCCTVSSSTALSKPGQRRPDELYLCVHPQRLLHAVGWLPIDSTVTLSFFPFGPSIYLLFCSISRFEYYRITSDPDRGRRGTRSWWKRSGSSRTNQ